MKKFISKFNLHNKINFNIFIVLFFAFVFRLILANFGTLELDHGTFVAWASSLAQGGFKTFYLGWSDYLPGYLYVLWILGKVNEVLPVFQTIFFKIPAIVADLATGYLIYKITSKLKNEKWAIISLLLYVFNPAIFANSTLWGQVDSLTALFSLFAIYLASNNKILLSAIMLAIGTLIKPQAAFVLPAILYLVIKDRWQIRKLFLYALAGLSTFVAGFIPFNNQSNLFQFILERLTVSSGQYKYGSVNAFSFWGLFGFWKPDTITFWIGLGVAFILIILLTVKIYKRKIVGGEYLVAGLSLLVTFLFMTRMHERHLLPVLAPLLVSTAINPMALVAYLGLSVTYLANLSYAYYWITEDFKEIFNPTLVKVFIITNLSLLFVFIISLFKKLTFNFKYEILSTLKPSRPSKDIAFKTKDITDKKATIFMSAILLFSLITHIYSLGIPKEMYFDEIYHSFTAKLVLHNDPKAWEWWNPHPEGFAYEWTHPPLSKLGMVLGMKVFGENSFGWRIPQAILGTLAVLLIYLLAKEMFKDKLVAILSSVIFSLAGLPLVLSRMGMNDSYVLFFSLLSIYLFIKDRNLFASIAFGLALASKWSAIYAMPILFISHFVFRKKIKLAYLSFLIVPALIYISSYTLMFTTGHTWENFVEVQKQMWWYHTTLVAEHPYTSPAWSWPILLRPIYLYDGGEVNGMVARIYASGNPIVFWFGLFSVIMAGIVSFIEKNKKIGFVVFGYVIFFLPWIASPRIMFLYHYLPSIPFMAIASGFVLRRFPKFSPYILFISLIAFVYFFPHWAGLSVPIWLDTSYYWFSSWR
jgi:predicted membrane-bound dolichyl-phosphate-mannose-protein mannosyltransferase